MPDKTRFFHQLLPLSNLALIDTNAQPGAQPPLQLLGPEPEHGWCYYFEKADLARQQGDWRQVVELGDLALAQGYNLHHKNMPELLPFIEGYARLKQWEQARRLSLQAYQAWEKMQPSLCDLWARLYQAKLFDDQGQATFEDMQLELGCASP